MSIKKIKDQLSYLKDSNPYLYYLWFKRLQAKGEKQEASTNDFDAIRELYMKKAGRYPNLIEPQLFSEKMQWLKLYYRNPLMPICADKLTVRDYISQKGYHDLLNDLLAVYDSIDQINLDKLPNQFVIKATHGSGWNLICRDKQKLNWFIWSKILKSWLESSLFWNGREWHYKDIKPKLICEKYLGDDQKGLNDYKIYCLNGKPRFLQANQGRGRKEHIQNFYSLQWEILPFGKDIPPNPDVKIQKPESLESMIHIATELSKPFPFVRVDFYEVSGNPKFGELTFFPASGMPDFIPSSYDKIVGDMLNLPNQTIQ